MTLVVEIDEKMVVPYPVWNRIRYIMPNDKLIGD